MGVELCKMFSTISGLYPIDTCSTPILSLLSSCDNQKCPRYSKMSGSSGGKIALVESHQLRSILKFTLETEAITFIIGKIRLWKGHFLSLKQQQQSLLTLGSRDGKEYLLDINQVPGTILGPGCYFIYSS